MSIKANIIHLLTIVFCLRRRLPLFLGLYRLSDHRSDRWHGRGCLHLVLLPGLSGRLVLPNRRLQWSCCLYGCWRRRGRCYGCSLVSEGASSFWAVL